MIQDRLFHQHIKVGPEGAYAGALAAIDIALWDLKGKVLGQPVWKLLGGAWRRELPFYASIGGNGQRSVDEVCRVVEQWLALGPAQVKIRFDADKTARDVDLAGDIAKARAVRKLVGDDFPLAFDSNNGYSVQGAIRVGRALEELGYVWFEEPVQHYHVESFAKVAAALDIAVSAGEQEYTLQGIKRLIEAGVDIVQPDIVKTGGFTGLGDMAALARAYGVDLVPHQTQPVDRSHGQPALRRLAHPLASPRRVQRPSRGPGRGVQDAGPARPGKVRPHGCAGAGARDGRERAAHAHDPLDVVRRERLSAARGGETSGSGWWHGRRRKEFAAAGARAGPDGPRPAGAIRARSHFWPRRAGTARPVSIRWSRCSPASGHRVLVTPTSPKRGELLRDGGTRCKRFRSQAGQRRVLRDGRRRRPRRRGHRAA